MGLYIFHALVRLWFFLTLAPSLYFFFADTEAMASSHLDNGPLLFSRLGLVGTEAMASPHLGTEHWYSNRVTNGTHEGVKSLNERLFD